MRFQELLDALPAGLAPRRAPASNPVIRGICYDSRQVSPGDLFVALRGGLADGHDFVAQARELGAAALLLEAPVAEDAQLAEAPVAENDTLALAIVPDTRRALAPIAARYFGEPSRELALIGITGTNGKTSTGFLVESILAAAGRRAGLIGTVEIRFAAERRRAVNTTPESLDLQRTLREMRNQQIDAVAMEVSSHGLALGRVAGCRFQVAAITNVTQDHLDFHDSMDSYRDAKLLLFAQHLAPNGTAVVNLDDPCAPHFLRAAANAGARTIRVTREASRDAEVRVLSTEMGLAGTRAELELAGERLTVSSPLLGDFNVENLAVAAGIGLAVETPLEAIARGVAECPQVPGRVERVVGPPGSPTVLVDYAHTPDAVDKLLAAARPLAPGRLISVFGCGGDRDRAKRPLMAEAVARHSDRAIATSDNPRTEDPQQILRDVEVGLSGLARVPSEALDATEHAATSLVDRREAIALAVRIARADDIVVIAGKGHEDYQILGREKLPFDDRDEAARALRETAS
jgi:UDP-N-acetylmuramoyl-L-alanyl-D-glutamate--2,6-diaminopimelate ligase